MGSLSKSNIYDAGSRPDPKKPRAVSYKGERRAEKWPSGIAERFVDLQGNVITRQLISPGLAATADAVNRERTRLHMAKNADGTVQGILEHGKCPLRHGLRHLTPLLEDEFSELPADLQRPCSSDPVTVSKGTRGAREYHDGCPHIEWLISARRKREADRLAAKSARTEGVLDIERKKLAAIEAQAKAASETNAKIVEALTNRQPPKKAPTE